MINEGVEPINFLNDLLEIIYFIQQKKILEILILICQYQSQKRKY